MGNLEIQNRSTRKRGKMGGGIKKKFSNPLKMDFSEGSVQKEGLQSKPLDGRSYQSGTSQNGGDPTVFLGGALGVKILVWVSSSYSRETRLVTFSKAI